MSATERARISEFERWVADNNIPASFEYAKGWWDYVELIRRFAAKFGINDVRVIGHYTIDTPPPEEKLPMPAVLLCARRVAIALRWDFGKMRRWPLEWTVSIRRESPYRGPTFGLLDGALDLRAEPIDGLSPEWRVPRQPGRI